MRLGVNWSSPRHLATVQSLLRNGDAEFCEILIDNFLHLPAREIRLAFPDVPVAFHIMNSRFIERDTIELKALAAKLKALRQELQPLYVSDHQALFSHEGRYWPILQEIDYQKQFALVRDRVALWQELMGTKVHLENFPSILDAGIGQPQFLESLVKETGAGILFDFSNALVAHKNCGVPLRAWGGIVKQSDHFHAAGYRMAGTDPDLVLDSHDTDLAPDTLKFIQSNTSSLNGRAGRTLVIERDAQIEEIPWASDLKKTRAIVP